MMTREELLAVNDRLENATRLLRQGHVGESLKAIGEAQEIVQAELRRADEWERELIRRVMESDEVQTGGHFAPPPHQGMMCADVGCDEVEP